MDFDPVMLARIQFAFTVSFHIVFPAFTIGLSAYIAVLLLLWGRTKNEKFLRLARFWTKIFAVSFAMGVVSGIVLSYQFGTNWSRFSVFTGNVIGPLIGYEVLTAFYLEATFFGGFAAWLDPLSAMADHDSGGARCARASESFDEPTWILFASGGYTQRLRPVHCAGRRGGSHGRKRRCRSHL